MLKAWTIKRATGIGIVAGLAALILWPVFAAWQDVRPLYLVALSVTAFCGLSILAITASDLILHRRRGNRLVAIRAFDVILGVLLAAPTLVALGAILPDLIALNALTG